MQMGGMHAASARRAIVDALAVVARRVARAVVPLELEASLLCPLLIWDVSVHFAAVFRAIEAEHAHAVLCTGVSAVVTVGAEVAQPTCSVDDVMPCDVM